MSKSNGKVINFLRKNAAIFIIAICIIAIGLTVTLTVLEKDKLLDNSGIIETGGDIEDETQTSGTETGEDTPTDPTPVVETVEFIMPVLNPNSVSDYSETMVFNSTLNRFNSHKAIDFYADEGAKVYAVYGGTVESIEYSLLTGYTITLDHGNNLKTVYNSLLDGDTVTIGDRVEQGEIIGEVSSSNRQEYKDGTHLHFEVKENGEFINPAKYLVFNEK